MVEGVVFRVTNLEFSRVGAFNFTKGKWQGSMAFPTGKELYEPFLKLLEEQGNAVAEEVCAEIVEDSGHLDHRYVTTII